MTKTKSTKKLGSNSRRTKRAVAHETTKTKTRVSATKSKTAKPKAAKPKTAKSKTAKPKAVKPEAVKPKTAKSKTAKPKAVKPKAAKPEAKARRTKQSPGRKASTAARFDGEKLAQLMPAARRGDLHAILGLAPDRQVRDALATPPEWGRGSYERLLALHLAGDAFGHPDVDGVIYDFAEHTYFRYDDEGYALAQLNADLGAIHATDRWGVFDEARAENYFRSALDGPYPDGVHEELDGVIASSARPLPLLAALRAAPLATADEPLRRVGSLDENVTFDD